MLSHYAELGLIYPMQYSSLFLPAPLDSASLTASMQGVEYATSNMNVPLAPPVAVRGVLRTSEAYVDRSVVLAAFELRDAVGNSRVSTGGVSVTLSVSDGSGNSQGAICALGGLSMPLRHYLGFCKLPSMPLGWFTSAGTATASLTLSVDDQEVASEALSGSITLQQQPTWYGTLASQFSAATAFAVLPVSPVYALESFDMPIYVHTGGYAVSTFWVWLMLDLDVVDYISFSQSSLYQTATLDYGGTSNEVLRFKAVGLQGSTTDAMVTGTSLQLLTVRLRMSSGASVGINSAAVQVRELCLGVRFAFRTAPLICVCHLCVLRSTLASSSTLAPIPSLRMPAATSLTTEPHTAALGVLLSRQNPPWGSLHTCPQAPHSPISQRSRGRRRATL